MSTAFLNALKVKSAVLQAKHAAYKHVSIPPEQRVENVGIEINSDFGTAKQNLIDTRTGEQVGKGYLENYYANSVGQSVLDSYKDAKIVRVDQHVNTTANEPTITIDRVHGKNRLDVFFSSVPSEQVRKDLKERCFNYDGERKAWFHKDTLLNRLFLSDYFNAPQLVDDSELPELSRLNDRIPVDTMPRVAQRIADTKPTERAELGSEDWEECKKQMGALQAHLKIDAPDLLILAIRSLYHETFPQ
jgi:hypothetical protein